MERLISFKDWLQEQILKAQDNAGLAYLEPTIPDSKSEMSKKIDKLYGREDGLAQNRKKRQ